MGIGLTTPSRKRFIVTETNVEETIIGGDGDDTSQGTGQMTEVNQTLQGVDTPTVDSLKPKVKTRIACWNVRTLYQTGKLAQVVREFHNYGLDILGVCEVRWTGSGQRTLASGHTILYSGRLNGHHTEGVALIMSRKMERTLIEWKPSGSRLLKARFNSKYTKLTVIVCYAPIEDAEEADKDAFYDQLQEVTDEVPTLHLLMVLGDLNARPGNNNIGRDRVMGKHGIGTINDNGERLCHFCDKKQHGHRRYLVSAQRYPQDDLDLAQ